MIWLTTIVTALGSLVGIWAIIRYVILIELRIDNATFRTLYDLSKEQKKFVLEEEFFTESRHPMLFRAICAFKDAPWFYLNHAERLLQAGYHGKDYVTVIICLRWQYQSLKLFLLEKLKTMQLATFGIPVQVATPWYTDKIGSLKWGPEPIISELLWKDIDQEVAEVVAGKRKKTSGIFYGEPGNGKTSFVKYLAVKYQLPIKLITFSPEFSNYDIMTMFAQINSKCIVLLEDFDNYFDGRRCIIGNSLSGGNNMGIKFTFDVILNCLDGVYNSYEGVIFIMTANDIEKVDSALKNRPSRFKYVRKFDNPDFETREKLIGEWAETTAGLNLDQIMRLKEFRELGHPLEAAMSKLEIEPQKTEPRWVLPLQN